MSDIRIDDHGRNREFLNLYYECKKEVPALEPNTVVASIALPAPMGHTPGLLWYRDIEDDFLPYLRAKRFPFTIM